METPVAEVFDGEAARIAHLSPDLGLTYFSAPDKTTERKRTDASRRARKRLKQLTHQTTIPPSNLTPVGLYRATQIGTRAQWNENADKQPSGVAILLVSGAQHGCMVSWTDNSQYQAYVNFIRAAKRERDAADDADEALVPNRIVTFKYKLPAGRRDQAGQILPQFSGTRCELFFPVHTYVFHATSVSIELDIRYRTTGRITLDVDSNGGEEVTDPERYLRAAQGISRKFTAAQRRLGIGM